VTSGPPPGPTAHDRGAYRAGTPRLAAVAEPLLRIFDQRRLRLLTPGLAGARAPARVIDAGAGRGRFVSAARAAGLDAEGIEPSQRGALAAAERYGVTVRPATVEDAGIAPASVDAVTLWHVLEHSEDPGAMLERVRDWLRPGGALLVGVPNLASLQARLGGGRWFHLDVPRHRVHFTPAGLEALLPRHALEPLGAHHVLAEHNPFGMWQSLTSRLTRTPSYAYHLLKHNAPLRSPDLLITLAALPLLPAAAALELAAGWAGRGGTIAVLARRVGE
jgi:SAM-dependent methyltransferase